MLHWYTLYTKPKREQQVHDILSKRGFEVYLPLLRLLKKRRLVQTQEPLFPCYLFVRTDIEQVGISTIAWTQGLRRVVSFCGQPAIVDDVVIEHIKRRLSEGNGPEVYGRFRHGEQVVVTEGPFKDLDAIFDGRLSGSGRVRVLLKIMGQLRPCEVHEAWLEKRA